MTQTTDHPTASASITLSRIAVSGALALAAASAVAGDIVVVPESQLGEAQVATPAVPASPVSAEVGALRAAHEKLVTKRTVLDPAREKLLLAAGQQTFAGAGKAWPVGELLLLVDRHPKGQEAIVAVATPGGWDLIGSSKISSGKPGSFDHFYTPLGLLENTTAHPSFRAEGTFNENKIRGYGVKGMRIFDLGWTPAQKGWGKPDQIDIRMQVHATDPVLEARLGQQASKGCIRVDSGLNRFLDQYGVLDADYERWERESGKRPWVWLKDRTPTSLSGRWVVIVEVAPVS